MSTDFGVVQVGRVQLLETYDLTEGVDDLTGDRTITLTGQEALPPLSLAQIRQRREDLLGLQDAFVPITFTNKSEHNGFYRVTSVSAVTVNATNEVVTVNWALVATFVGVDNQVDIESRILKSAVRLNDFSLTGTRTLAPAIGHYAFLAGGPVASVPTSIVRVGSQGSQILYTLVTAVPSARWGVAVGSYLSGRVELLQDGVERAGVNLAMTVSGWALDNGMINVSAGVSGQINVSTYSGGAYHAKPVNISVAGSTAGSQLTGYDAVTVLRNEPEQVTVRLVRTRTGTATGRAQLDLTLRRGARIVEGYLQSDSSLATSLAVWLATSEASSNLGNGVVTATGNDTNGNRYVIGTARNYALHASGGISKSVTATLDFFIGAAVAGGSAIAGDAATDLRDQYLGFPPETVTGIRR